MNTSATPTALTVTEEEEAEIRTRIITQMAPPSTKNPDYPLKRVVKTFFEYSSALDRGDADEIAQAKETFLIELDTYAFSMSRHDLVVHAQRSQQRAYEEEEEMLYAKARELGAELKALKTELRATARERKCRVATEEAIRACEEYPSRAESAQAVETLKRVVDELRAERDGLDAKVEARKRKFALLLEVIDSLS